MTSQRPVMGREATKMTKTLRSKIIEIIQFQCFEECADVNFPIKMADKILKEIRKRAPKEKKLIDFSLKDDANTEGFNACREEFLKELK